MKKIWAGLPEAKDHHVKVITQDPNHMKRCTLEVWEDDGFNLVYPGADAAYIARFGLESLDLNTPPPDTMGAIYDIDTPVYSSDIQTPPFSFPEVPQHAFQYSKSSNRERDVNEHRNDVVDRVIPPSSQLVIEAAPSSTVDQNNVEPFNWSWRDIAPFKTHTYIRNDNIPSTTRRYYADPSDSIYGEQ